VTAAAATRNLPQIRAAAKSPASKNKVRKREEEEEEDKEKRRGVYPFP